MDKKVIFFIITSKVLIFAAIIIGFFNFPFIAFNYQYHFHYPVNEPITLQTAFKTWDTQHYLYLSQFWYRPGQFSNGFFPLLPLLIRIFIPIFHNPLIIGLVVSNIFSAVGVIFFYLFVKSYFKNSSEIALWSIVILLVFPTSFFFAMVYSESICFCLTILLFYFLYKNQFKTASFFAFFIPLCRPVGILIIIPLVYYLIAYNKQSFQTLSWRHRLKSLSLIKKFLPALSPIFGIMLYLIMMYLATGSIFSGMASLKENPAGWQTSFDPLLFLKNLFALTSWLHTYNNSIQDRLFFGFYLVLLYFIYKKLDKTLFVYALVMGLLPLLGSFTSYMRYILMVFPIFMVLALFFQEKEYKISKYLLIGVLIFSQLVLAIKHALYYWVA